MVALKLKAEKRKLYGRKIKKLREKGILPANIYGKKIKSQAIKVNLKEFLRLYKEIGKTGILSLSLLKETKIRPVLVHNFQKDPVSDDPLHVDFHQIDLKTKVQVSIPIKFKGESPAVIKGGVLIQLMNEIEIEALPTDLPDRFEVDISKIEEIGQGIVIKDLKVDKKKIKILVDNKDELIIKVEEPKEEEEKPVEEVSVEEEESKLEEDKVKESEDDKSEDKEDKSNEAKPEEE